MNTLKIYPESLRKQYIHNLKNSGITSSPISYHNKILKISLSISLFSMIIFFFLKINLFYSLLVLSILLVFFYFKIDLKSSARIKRMEHIFPDVISLMSSNLRAGMTVDRAFLLASRPEFDPLDAEILKTGKDISTGKEIEIAFQDMAIRIGSEKISKTVNLILSGLKSGGSMAELLEQTSINMKEKEFIEKKSSSSILMYVIFITFSIAVGAPLLFSLSTILIETIINLAAQVPSSGAGSDLPLSFGNIPISPEFIIYYSIILMILIDLISCLVIGLVNKGNSKSGLRYFIPILATSLGIFFSIRLVLRGLFLGLS
jgi:flagellar protein FlaJ